jgi:hypothetical protein
VGWQPSRFLADRAEAERAFQLAEQLGSVNAAAQQLDTTWPSLRKAFTRHGLGMPTRNPQAVRQRAIDAAHQRTGQPATPSLDPVFAALNPDALPARERSEAELSQWVRRDEQYATLGRQRGGRAVQRKPRPPAHHPRLGDHPTGRPQPPAGRPTRQPPPSAAAPTEPIAPAGPSNPRSERWWPIPADPVSDHPRLDAGFVAHVLT